MCTYMQIPYEQYNNDTITHLYDLIVCHNLSGATMLEVRIHLKTVVMIINNVAIKNC